MSPQTSKNLYIFVSDVSSRGYITPILQSAGFNVQLFLSVDDLLDAIQDGEPHCVLMDIETPRSSDLEAVRLLRQNSREIPIIIISGCADISTAVKVMRSGASDFIARPFQTDTLLTSIRRASQKSHPRRPRVPIRQASNPLFKRLTVRESEVLALLLQGDQNKQVASKLGISPRTVEVHRAKIMRRLQATSFAQLVKLATLSGHRKTEATIWRHNRRVILSSFT